MIKNLIAVIGPTGVGKSKLAIELAQKFKGEIVNADSMQVYKGMDIITNKITKDEMCGIRHCLMDEIDPITESFTVQDWTRNAINKIQEIQERGMISILMGGTHYYLQSILTSELITSESTYISVNQVPVFKDIIEQVKNVLDKSRLEPNEYAQELLELLKIVDPIMGNRWHPKDGRKIRRSLEVFHTTGSRQSDIIKKQKVDPKPRYTVGLINDELLVSDLDSDAE